MDTLKVVFDGLGFELATWIEFEDYDYSSEHDKHAVEVAVKKLNELGFSNITADNFAEIFVV